MTLLDSTAIPQPLTAQDKRFHAALPDALMLVGAVHDRSVSRAHQLLRDADLPAVAVVLAALVDDDRRLHELLAWTAYEVRLRPACDPADDRSVGSTAMHGTRSRYTAGCRGDGCRKAESEYQAARYQRTKQRRCA